MLEENAYDKYRKHLKEIIFSSGKIKTAKIMREMFRINDVHNCSQFHLIATNNAKGLEQIWGKFYIIPTNVKQKKYIIIFEYLLQDNSQYTGCVEWSKDHTELIIRSLLNKDHHITLTHNDAPNFPGIIIPCPDVKGAKRVNKGHWKILQKYFKKINVNI